VSAPRWLRKQQRRIIDDLDDLHAEIDRVWLDLYQLLRAHGLRSTVDPERDRR